MLKSEPNRINLDLISLCTKFRNQAPEIDKKMKETPTLRQMAVGLTNNILPTWMENLESMVTSITTSTVSIEIVEHSAKLPKKIKNQKRDKKISESVG